MHMHIHILVRKLLYLAYILEALQLGIPHACVRIYIANEGSVSRVAKPYLRCCPTTGDSSTVGADLDHKGLRGEHLRVDLNTVY